MTTVLERIRLVGELGKASADLRAAESPIAKIKAGAAVRALLDRLGAGQSARSPGLTLDRNNAEASRAALRTYWQDGLASVPEPLRPFEASLVADLAKTLGDKELETRAQILAGAATDQQKLDALALISAKGLPIPFDRESVLGSIKEREAAREAIKATRSAEANAINARVRALNEQYTAESRRLMQKASEIRAAVRAGAAHPNDENAVIDALELARKEHNAKYNELVAEFNSKVSSAPANLDIGQPEVKEEGQAVINAVMEKSKITETQARDWAARQPVQKATLAYLKKTGYTEAKLRADMADFYRISGGKIPEIEIETAKSGRAHASGIAATVVRKSIAVGKNFTRTVLFHELGHHLEADASAYAAAVGYLLKRRRSPKKVSLRSITGNNGYKPNEVAYEDDFLSPYIGKVYPYKVTEVFSMGVQYLADPENAAVMAAKDPELYALITGYLTQDSTPAMRALLELQRDASDGNKSAESEIQERFAAAIKSLASGIDLTDDGWWGAQGEQGRNRGAVLRQAKAKSKLAYIGRFGAWNVFSGVFRNQRTSRWQKGHLVFYDAGGYPDMAAVFDGIESAKALIRLSKEDGVQVDTANQRFFLPRFRVDVRQIVIDRAGDGA